MNRFLLLIVFIVAAIPVSAQKQNNIWAFGNKAGLDFSSGAPVAIQTNILANQGCATISSPTTGKLLFYTNGNRVWNRNHAPMVQGFQLAAGPNMDGACQSAVIVPFFNDSTRFYIFSIGGFSVFGSLPNASVLNYSVVDMTLNNGLGDVITTQRGIQIDSKLQEKMVAVQGDNCNIWLLVHDLDTTFKAYEITAAGINPTPVRSSVGYSFTQKALSNRIGGMKISPNRKKLIATYTFAPSLEYGPGGELYDFDPATGKVSNPMELDLYRFFGACFSPDNNKLYLTSYVPNSYYLLQYDLTTNNLAAILTSRAELRKTGSGEDLQLGPDGKIYLSRLNKDSLAIIHNPNGTPATCNFVWNGMRVAPGTKPLGGMQNLVVYPQPKDTMQYVSDTFFCSNNMSPITLNTQPGYQSYTWNDKDTAQTRIITQPGTYWVLSGADCHSRADTFRVRYHNADINLGPDTTYCFKTEMLLTVPLVPNAQIRWNDGSTDSTYLARQNYEGAFYATVTNGPCRNSDTVALKFLHVSLQYLKDQTLCAGETLHLKALAFPQQHIRWDDGSSNEQFATTVPGKHWVTVREDICQLSDTMNLTYDAFCNCYYSLPNAFTPDHNGSNDVFRLRIPQGCPVKGFELEVYNRWGEKVFQSLDVTKGWDGTFGGQKSEVGTYSYFVRLETGSSSKPVYLKGDVLLMR